MIILITVIIPIVIITPFMDGKPLGREGPSRSNMVGRSAHSK
jgi:hypothetical protein